MCRIDLAPDAPWSCPENCPGYERKLMDATWEVGSLGAPMESEPEAPTIDASASALLDQAENIINSAGSDIIDEVREERARIAAERPSLLDKLFRRNRKRR